MPRKEIYKHRKEISDYLGLGVEWGWPANRPQGMFGGDGNVLKLGCGVCTAL